MGAWRVFYFFFRFLFVFFPRFVAASKWRFNRTPANRVRRRLHRVHRDRFTGRDVFVFVARHCGVFYFIFLFFYVLFTGHGRTAYGDAVRRSVSRTSVESADRGENAISRPRAFELIALRAAGRAIYRQLFLKGFCMGEFYRILSALNIQYFPRYSTARI